MKIFTSDFSRWSRLLQPLIISRHFSHVIGYHVHAAHRTRLNIAADIYDSQAL